MYDGPEQIENLKMTKDPGVPSDFVILRDRWYDEKDYGIKLTNRTGTIDIGKQDQVIISLIVITHLILF